MHDPALELVYAHPALADLDPSDRRAAIETLLRDRVAPDALATETERVVRSIDGFGPLTELLGDDSVTDVMVNGTDVWVERNGSLSRSNVRVDTEELAALVERLVGDGGGRVDALHPMCDVRLTTGARMHVVGPPITDGGFVVSIRRFATEPFDLDDLVRLEMMSPGDAYVLHELVRARSSIAISGATGAGKTTLLGALLGQVPATERVIVIEEVRELRIASDHVVHLTTREANVEQTGAITTSDLVRTALRMRPDRIVVGEVRGTEAADALWAMSTGHKGSMVTVHADGAVRVPDVLARLAGEGPQLADGFRACIDAFVHLERVDGRRVVAEILVR